MPRTKHGLMGIYNATPITLPNGAGAALALDSAGRAIVVLGTAIAGEDTTSNTLGVTQKLLASATYTPTLHTNFGAATKANVAASTANVLSVYVINRNAAVRYFQLHNKATAPAATEVPIYSFAVPAGTTNNPGVVSLGSDFFTSNGRNFSTGLGWAISTTEGTFTDSATANEHSVYIHFK